MVATKRQASKTTAKTATKTATAKTTAAKKKSEPQSSSVPVEESPTVDEVAAESPKITGMNYEVDSYRIEVRQEGAIAVYRVISSADAVVIEGQVEGVTLTYPGLKEKRIESLQHALMTALEKYNLMFPLKPGNVSISRLVPHPYNSMLYDENSSLDELGRLMTQPDFKMDELVVTSTGRVLSGNTRLQKALELNVEAIRSGRPRPYLELPIKIEDYDDLDSELERIRRGNIYRQKTAADKKREAAIAAKSLVLTAKKATTGRVGEVSTKAVEAVAKETGMSPRNVENLVAVQKALPELPKQLATKVEKIAESSPRSAAEITRALPPKHISVSKEEYQEAIADEIINAPKRISSKVAKEQVDKRLSMDAAKEKHSDKIAEAIAAGDKPNDNRYTPDELVEAGVAFMGGIDIDAFATVTNPQRVPADKAYTILDDAWSQELKGRVFANPPFSRAVESCALLDSWLRKKEGIKKLYLVTLFSVLSSKAVHLMLSDFNMMVCHPEGRVNFPVGELLQTLNPDATEGNNRDLTVVLAYSEDEKDYETLARIFPGWCGRRQLFGKEAEAIVEQSVISPSQSPEETIAPENLEF